jgi:hypothetical protein
MSSLGKAKNDNILDKSLDRKSRKLCVDQIKVFLKYFYRIL